MPSQQMIRRVANLKLLKSNRQTYQRRCIAVMLQVGDLIVRFDVVDAMARFFGAETNVATSATTLDLAS